MTGINWNCCWIGTLEQLIARNNAELGFDTLENRVNDAYRRVLPKNESPCQQSIMDQQWCQTGYWKEAESLWNKKKNDNEETVSEYIKPATSKKTNAGKTLNGIRHWKKLWTQLQKLE